ncbi:D-tyrosyl-tRNA(Tyr) deacylase [Nannocystis exedens]|uniref:D-aminoacyl-tRNA deacylase n=1 Tax=Nannocystis exedens TaxID=54 RepID=A0A1I1SVM5_9BACT|nr:D-aminoacyl-tRNA deacylase [Nannocystis exedens]PCC66967.1 D-tyrosyl-tRNA(Tyr) deacylase [Nannocystis exedens]SFD50402.1 D-tyrosyl-tRNA(Tyr) deacylase [Nannocystis exedens]
MLTVIQRVSRAAVRVDGEVVGAIERGAMLLVAVERGDVEADAVATARKIAALRFFPGATPMDRTLAEVGGGVLVVSQFTLAGTLRKGRRPSFDGAELPERARALYEAVAAALRAEGLTVATGRFAAHMEVELVNDGPVTFLLRSVAGQVQ